MRYARCQIREGLPSGHQQRSRSDVDVALFVSNPRFERSAIAATLCCQCQTELRSPGKQVNRALLVHLASESQYRFPLALADHVAKKLDARLRRRLAHPCMRGAAQALARRDGPWVDFWNFRGARPRPRNPIAAQPAERPPRGSRPSGSRRSPTNSTCACQRSSSAGSHTLRHSSQSEIRATYSALTGWILEADDAGLEPAMTILWLTREVSQTAQAHPRALDHLLEGPEPMFPCHRPPVDFHFPVVETRPT